MKLLDFAEEIETIDGISAKQVRAQNKNYTGLISFQYWKHKQDKSSALRYLEQAFNAGYNDFDSLYDLKRDGYFLQGLNQTSEFRELIDKYKKR